MPALEPGTLGGSLAQVHGMTRFQILKHLRLRGEASVDDLSQALGITATSVRQHLALLQGEGLVVLRRQRSGPGRPRHLYRLSQAAEEQFPRSYGEFASDVLEVVEELGGQEQVRQLLQLRARRLARQLRGQITAPDLAGRMSQLARALNQQGCMAEVRPRPAGGFILEVHNCLVRQVATSWQEVCDSEAEMYCQVLGAAVTREACLATGELACRHLVLP